MICALLVFQTHDLRPAARPHLAVARHADPRARRRRSPTSTRRRTAGSSRPTRRSTGCRTTRASRTSASAATRATSRSRGTTTSANMNFEALLGARAARSGSTTSPSCSPTVRPSRAESEIERFWLWVDEPSATGRGRNAAASPPWCITSSTFWAVRDRPNVVLLHYDDLKADLEGQMRALARAARHLGSRGPRWPELVEAATFERMRAGADRIAPDTTNAIWQSNQQFFHRGVERPVARPARRRRSAPLLRTGRRARRSRARPLVAPRVAAGAVDRPAASPPAITGRITPTIGSSSRAPIRSTTFLNKPGFLELVPAPGRLHHRGGLRRGPRRPRASRARSPGGRASTPRPRWPGPPLLTASASRWPSPTSPGCRSRRRRPTWWCASWCSWTSRISTARSPSWLGCSRPAAHLRRDHAPDHDERARSYPATSTARSTWAST